MATTPAFCTSTTRTITSAPRRTTSRTPAPPTSTPRCPRARRAAASWTCAARTARAPCRLMPPARPPRARGPAPCRHAMPCHAMPCRRAARDGCEQQAAAGPRAQLAVCGTLAALASVLNCYLSRARPRALPQRSLGVGAADVGRAGAGVRAERQRAAAHAALPPGERHGRHARGGGLGGATPSLPIRWRGAGLPARPEPLSVTASSFHAVPDGKGGEGGADEKAPVRRGSWEGKDRRPRRRRAAAGAHATVRCRRCS